MATASRCQVAAPAGAGEAVVRPTELPRLVALLPVRAVVAAVRHRRALMARHRRRRAARVLVSVHNRVKANPLSGTRTAVAKVVVPVATAARVVVGMERPSRQVASVSEWPATAIAGARHHQWRRQDAVGPNHVGS